MQKFTDFISAVWQFILKAVVYKGWIPLVAFLVYLLIFGWSGFVFGLAWGIGGTLTWVQFREEIIAWWKRP